MKSVLYFHGFASLPGSAKITALRPLLAPQGIDLNTPDLNASSFAKLDENVIVDLSGIAGFNGAVLICASAKNFDQPNVEQTGVSALHSTRASAEGPQT